MDGHFLLCRLGKVFCLNPNWYVPINSGTNHVELVKTPQFQGHGFQQDCFHPRPSIYTPRNLSLPSLPRIDNSLEWLIELKKVLYLWLLLYYKKIQLRNSQVKGQREQGLWGFQNASIFSLCRNEACHFAGISLCSPTRNHKQILMSRVFFPPLGGWVSLHRHGWLNIDPMIELNP